MVDAYARRIVGWRGSRTAAHASPVLDALERALHGRRPLGGDGLVRQSDRGRRCVSITYTGRLAAAGIGPSPPPPTDGPIPAEAIVGLYEAGVIRRRGPWRGLDAVEFATLEWVDRFNNRRLLEPIGGIPPAEAEERYWAQAEHAAKAA